MSNLKFAPGEQDVIVDSFSPSVLMFWLKTEIGASTTRVVKREPNTLLGLIPLGASDDAIPLANVANVGVNTKFSVGRGIFGLLFLIMGVAIGGAAFIFALLGLSMLLNSFSASLEFQNNGGGTTSTRVSVLEKAKLEALREQINQRVFADYAGLRHTETMDLNQAQLQAQQRLNNHMMQPQSQPYTQPPVPSQWQGPSDPATQQFQPPTVPQNGHPGAPAV